MSKDIRRRLRGSESLLETMAEMAISHKSEPEINEGEQLETELLEHKDDPGTTTEAAVAPLAKRKGKYFYKYLLLDDFQIG